MNYRLATIILAAVLLLILGSNDTSAAPLNQPPLQDGLPPGGPDSAAVQYHFTNHGTAWVAENPGQFSFWHPRGWGMQARSPIVSVQQWVHISIPIMTYTASQPLKIYYVQFCAQSTNGAITKPIQWTMWASNGQFFAENIVWPANNNKNCVGHFFNPAIWKEDLGISVLLKYANSVDMITLYKAWAALIP